MLTRPKTSNIHAYILNRGAKAEEVARIVWAVYGDNATGESTATKWFSRFKEDRFDISDIPCSEIPSGFDEDHLNTLIHNDPRPSNRQLAKVIVFELCDTF